LPMLLFLPWFWRMATRFAEEGEGGPGADAALLAFAFGSMAFPYALLFFSHAPAMAFAGGAFVAAVRAVRDGGRAWPVGLLAASAVACDYQAVLAAAVIGVYLVAASPRRLGQAVE